MVPELDMTVSVSEIDCRHIKWRINDGHSETGGECMKVFCSLILVLALSGSAWASNQTRNPALDETVTVRLGPFLANLDATV